MLMIIFEQSEHHSMVGSVKDPDDPKGVAASIFAAVAVYAVCCLAPFQNLVENTRSAQVGLNWK